MSAEANSVKNQLSVLLEIDASKQNIEKLKDLHLMLETMIAIREDMMKLESLVDKIILPSSTATESGTITPLSTDSPRAIVRPLLFTTIQERPAIEEQKEECKPSH